MSDFGPIALLIALAAAYTAGVQRAWARAGRDRLVRVHQAVSFALGLAATLAALVLLTTVIGPLVQIATLLYVLIPLWRGRAAIGDDRELARLYRYLVAQGFEPDSVRRRLDLLRRDARR